MHQIETKLQKLEAKQSLLVQEIKNLSEKRNQSLVKILEKLPLNSVDTFTLIGGIMDVINRSQTDTQKKEEWFEAGATFLRSRKKTSKPSHTSQQQTKNQIKADEQNHLPKN